MLSLLSFRDTTVTEGLRSIVSLWIDIFLPYYVASRSIRNMEGLRHALTGFVMAAMVLAPIAVFEAVRGWRLYPATMDILGLPMNVFGSYLIRSGFLRPTGTVMNSIVLGYVMVVALGFFVYLKGNLGRPMHRWLGLTVLSGGILASLSRGPWVGAAFLVIVFILLGPRPVGRLVKSGLLGSAALLVLAQLPHGQLFIDMMPGFGTVEQGNVEYRADLLTNALPVIERHLLFGSTDFLYAPELQVMMQGEGIIDIVNSYVGVALNFGVVGLVFFAGAFATAFLQLRRGMRLARQINPDDVVMGRALWATLAAIMLIIYTVSSISIVPTVYWPVIGLCVAYAKAMKDASENLKEARR
ncbi:MAG: O-antigen ligase domain-containing protein [Alcaligenaceae bacterium]|nr:MAG: O-antigen ligase domain-containing protein [Alcaligenaceae bacterium]